MLKKIVETLALKIKKRAINIDEKIPDSYLWSLLFSKFFMVVRGWLHFRSLNIILVGSGVTIKARSLIKVGKGLVIEDRCIIDAVSTDGIIFGHGVSLNRGVAIECTGSLTKLGKGIYIGNNVGIGCGSFFGCSGGIFIGDDTIIGNFVTFHSENHMYSDALIPIRLQGVHSVGITIGRNCWIGANVTILDGVILGDGCVIAAGSVVKSGVYEEQSIYAGVPANYIRSRLSISEK